MWFILALLAAVSFALSTFYFKKGFANLTVSQSMWLETIVTIFTVGAYYLLRGNFSSVRLGEVFVLGVFATGIYAFHLYAYKKSKISITSSITSLSPLFVAILAYFFLGQTFSFWGIVLIFITIIGVFFISIDPVEMIQLTSFKKITIQSYLKWGVLSLLANIFMDLTAGKILSYSTPTTYLVMLVPAEVAIALPMLLIKKQSAHIFTKKHKLGNTILGALFMSLGTIFFFEAIAVGKVAYVSAVANFSVVFSVSLGLFFLKEKVTKVQFIGMAIVIIGVLLFGFIA